MKKKTVAKSQGLAGRQNQFAIAFAPLRTKRVDCDQPVIAGMPPGGIAQVGGVRKDCHACILTLDFAPIMHPVGPLPPNAFPFDALAVDRLAEHFLDAFAGVCA